MRCLTPMVIIFATLAIMSISHAGQGVLEINQTCAVNDGCFAGDDPGFPVQLNSMASYVLSSNLDVPADTDGLFLDAAAAGSSIDLNGFAIQGPLSCDGTPVTGCTGSSLGRGIAGSAAIDVTVRNGVVAGMGDYGIFLRDDAQVYGVRLKENGDGGVSVSESSMLRNVSATRNGGDGVQGGLRTTYTNVQSGGNGGHGISAADGSSLQQVLAQFNAVDGLSLGAEIALVGGTAQNNGANGVTAGSSSTIRGFTAWGNGDNGFEVDGGSVVVNSTSRGNGQAGLDIFPGSVVKHFSSTADSGDGIFLRAGNSSVIDSAVSSSGDDGIDCDAAFDGGAVKGNVLVGNSNQALRNCTQIGTNFCDGNTTCP